MTKKKIFLVPSYIAALRHYEKLIPHLKEAGFEVEFFLFGKSSMTDYCEEQKLPYKLLRDEQLFKAVGLKNIPVLSPIKERKETAAALEAFFKEEKPYAVISAFPHNQFRMQAMVAAAKKNGVRSIVLQWALGPKENVPTHRFRRQILRPKEYPFLIRRGLLKIHRLIVNLLSPEHNYSNWDADVFLLITEGDRETRLLMGYPKEKLKVVGSLDVEFVRALHERVKHEKGFKESLQKKYGFDPKKKNILIISTTFHMEATTKFTDNAGQIKYFEDTIKTIQEVYPKEEAEIVFKMHPREQDIYTNAYKKYGVKVFGRESSVEELIILCDLYLSHPLTSTNFSSSGVLKDSIFLNFSPYDFLDETGKNFGIKEIAKTQEAFLKKLQDYKAGKLPRQYDDIFKKDAVKNILDVVLDR